MSLDQRKVSRALLILFAAVAILAVVELARCAGAATPPPRQWCSPDAPRTAGWWRACRGATALPGQDRRIDR